VEADEYDSMNQSDQHEQNLIREYVGILPAAEQENYQEQGNWNHFISGMADLRSQLGHKIRKQASLAVFGPTIAQTLLDDNSRAECLELKKMVGWDEEKNAYTSCVPLLYSEGDGPRRERAFRSEVLMRALRVILFGPSSLNEGNTTSTRETYGKLWGVKAVTAGAMATAATVVRWALSADKELCEFGGATSIKYDEFFQSTKKVAAALNSFPEGKETIKQWNEFVFRGHSICDTLIPFTEEEDDDLAALLADINAAASLQLHTPPPSDGDIPPPPPNDINTNPLPPGDNIPAA